MAIAQPNVEELDPGPQDLIDNGRILVTNDGIHSRSHSALAHEIQHA
jgi:hypothetical protein